MAPGEECATEQIAAFFTWPQKGPLVARISHNPQSEPKVDDGYLIALAKLGDRNAYDRLVRRYHGFVRLKASSYPPSRTHGGIEASSEVPPAV